MAGRRFWHVLAWVVGIIVLVAVLGGLVIVSGIYNVAAACPDIAPVRWVLRAASDRSVERHAAGLVTPRLDAPALARRGAGLYARRCTLCHGGPGARPAPFARGMNPAPPDLAESAGDLDAREIFWVAKNGIRMTGMPAFGPSTADNDLWAVTAHVMSFAAAARP